MKASSVSSRLPRWLRQLAVLAGAAALCGALAVALAGCVGASAGDTAAAGDSASASGGSGASANAPISVYSREDGSGTRGAFVELFGIEQKDANGDKVDMTTPAAAITNSTAVMMTSVAGDPNAIGYISLGSLDDTVKAVSIDGVAPTAAAVKDGSYAIARPFNIVTKGELAAPAADFLAFIMSAEGQAVVSDNNYIAIDDAAAPFASNGVSGKVVVAGSSSVTPVMEKLAEAFQSANPQVTVEVQQSDSTTGVNMALDGTCDIGMASRDLKDSEAGAGAEGTPIALDGIAVIVAPTSSVSDLTSQQVCGHLYRRGYQLGRRRLSGIDYAVLPAEHAASKCIDGRRLRGRRSARSRRRSRSCRCPRGGPRAQARPACPARRGRPRPVRRSRGPLHRRRGADLPVSAGQRRAGHGRDRAAGIPLRHHVAPGQ